AAADAADALVAAGVLRDARPLEFTHPIVRAALYEDLSESSKAEAHRRAAAALESGGASATAVATHLRHSPPAANPGTVATLRRAAREALARGAPAAAVTHLTRALAEPPAPDERGVVLRELGVAEALDQRPVAVDHLREALSLARFPRDLTVAALALGQALSYAGEIDAAYEVARATLDRLPADTDVPTLELEELRLATAGRTGGRGRRRGARRRQATGRRRGP
ncbi:MAG: hypothetical protein ACRD0U_01230, partial [Acidimicrobiales bacterium]